MAPESGKLEKLKISAYGKRSRSEADRIGVFEAMFNPESFTQRYEIAYSKGQGHNSTGKTVDYSRSKPRELRLKLVLDGSGVGEMWGPGSGGRRKVSDRVKELLDLTFRMNGSIHEPNFLKVEWGDLIFSCRLLSVDITYQSFSRDGSALRAELDVTLLSDEDVKKRMAEENKSSPDLTHSRVVKNGDVLPLLCKEVYGSAAHYLYVARANGLDDFRNLTPGETIFFPPLPGT